MADADRFEQFAAMMSELHLWQAYGSALLDSGFDEWLSIRELDDKLLQDLGVQDQTHRLKIVACVEAARAIDPSEDPGEDRRAQLMGSEDFKYSQSSAQQQQQPGSRQAGFSALKFDSLQPDGGEELGAEAYAETRQCSQEVSLYPQQLLRTIVPSASKVQRWSYTKMHRHESERKFFQRTMNLYIKSAGLNKIVGSGQQANLEDFPNLKILDLSYNELSKIEGLDSLKKLEILNLQNNQIRKIEGLDYLQQLKKLYLTRNCIGRLEGLQYCMALEELTLSHQKLGHHEHLIIEEDSAIGMSNSLQSLELNDCRVKDTYNLQFLRFLHSLQLKNNLIDSVESLQPALVGLSSLESLQLQGNPVEQEPKHRDKIIMVNRSIEWLSEKKILLHERQFLFEDFAAAVSFVQKVAREAEKACHHPDIDIRPNRGPQWESLFPAAPTPAARPLFRRSTV